MNEEPIIGARYGWICPKCGAVMSPDTSFCPNCAPQQSTVEAWNGHNALLAITEIFKKGGCGKQIDSDVEEQTEENG